MTADSQVERLSCGAGCRMVLLYYFRVRSGLFGIPPSCPSTPHHSLVRPQSVLGMALTTGTDLLGEIDGSKVEAANRCYYAAAVTPLTFLLKTRLISLSGIWHLFRCVDNGSNVWS